MKTPRAHLWDEIAEIAALHQIPLKMLRSDSRKRCVVECRNAAFYAMRKNHGMSFPRIAAFFDRDHATVIHGVGRHLIVNRIDDPELGHLADYVERQNERRRGYWRAKVEKRKQT